MSSITQWSIRKLCAGVIAGALLFATACASDSDTDEAADDVVTAATAAVTEAPTTEMPATTAAPTTAPPTTVAELPADAIELLRTAFENSAGRSVRGDMQMDMGELATVASHFESDGQQNFSMTMSFDEMMGSEGPAGFGFEARFVDGASYMQFVVPEELRALVGDELPEGWFTLDTETAAAMGIVCPSPLPGETPADGTCRLPNDNTNQLEFVTSAEIVGKELVEGRSTTHVRYTLDAAAMAEGVLAEAGAAGGSLPFAGDMFPGEIAFDAWIDQHGLTRRISVDLGSLMEEFMGELDESESGGMEQGLAGLFDMSNVINFYDYDADITIEAPPPDEIVGDFGDLTGAG